MRRIVTTGGNMAMGPPNLTTIKSIEVEWDYIPTVTITMDGETAESLRLALATVECSDRVSDSVRWMATVLLRSMHAVMVSGARLDSREV